jgi:hypothetical protein
METELQSSQREVYCVNCRYYVLSTIEDETRFYCNAPTGKIINDHIKGKYKERIFKAIDDEGYPNNRETGDCKYYKREWYMFWVK